MRGSADRLLASTGGFGYADDMMRNALPALRALVITAASLSTGCATIWQVNALEEKIDTLLKQTQRETLRDVFGEQTQAIHEKLDGADRDRKQQVDQLLSEYQKGNTSLEEVRGSIMTTLGGADRVVSSSGGIWVRDENGKKVKSLGRNGKLKNAQKVPEDQLPTSIAESKGLSNYTWGRADVDGRQVLFPWELTMSAFAKEIVENTARRTAEEFIRMGGEKAFRRPVHIQVVTDPNQTMKVNYDGVEDEVVVTGDKDVKVQEKK
jgi:hypothetical protein